MKNRYIWLSAGIILIVSVLSASPKKLDTLVRDIWINIGKSVTICSDYDYFPQGGMRNFACRIGHFTTYKAFSNLIGVPVFLKGPHKSGTLNLNSSDFGWYNPAFVKKLRQTAIPAVKDKKFRAATLKNYSLYISPLARIYYVTYRKIKAHPVFINIEKTEYQAAVKESRRYDYETFFYFMNPEFFTNSDPDFLAANGFDGGYDGNVVKTAVAFWIRRHIDGTADEFFKGLSLLTETYDPEFKTNADRADWY